MHGNRHEIVDSIAPIDLLAGLRVRAAACDDEIQHRTIELDLCEDLAVEQLPPVDRQIDAPHRDERHRHIVVGLDDAQAIDGVRRADQRDIDVVDVPGPRAPPGAR